MHLAIRRPTLLSFLALSLLMSVARAEDLPKAEMILDDSIKAMGGKEAMLKIKNRVVKGSMELPAAGLKGTIIVTQAEPAKMATVVEFAAIGKTVQGSDGKNAWESSAVGGARLHKGEELANTLRQADIHADVEWRKYYEKVETVGVEDVEGKPAYKVVLTPKEGKPETSFYDKATKLEVKSVQSVKSPQGEIEVESITLEWKDFDGIKIPVKSKQKILTQELVTTIDEVKQNVDLPEDTFAPPADVKPLLKKVD